MIRLVHNSLLRAIQLSSGVKWLTFEDWLESGTDPIPPGFKEWRYTYSHWDQGDPVGWAIYCFNNKRIISKMRMDGTVA